MDRWIAVQRISGRLLLLDGSTNNKVDDDVTFLKNRTKK